jgi:hypothetical protein
METVEIGECPEDCFQFVPVNLTIVGDFLVGIGVGNFSSPPVVTEKRHIRHSGFQFRN